MDYEANINKYDVTIAAALLTGNAIIASELVQIFKGTDEIATVSGNATSAGVEGTENDKVFTVTMEGTGTKKFSVVQKTDATRITFSTATIGTVVYQTNGTIGFYRLTNLPHTVDANWTLLTLASLVTATGLPSGVTIDGLAVTTDETVLEVTLNGKTNEDYDVNRRVNLTFSSLIRSAGAFSAPAIMPATVETGTLTGTAIYGGNGTNAGADENKVLHSVEGVENNTT
jgi:hypothetical protein